MALSRTNTQNTKKHNTLDTFQNVKVERVHDFGNGRISFNATFGMGSSDDPIRLVTVYGLTWVEGEKDGKEYSFVSMPQQKAKDGNYYNHCYLTISEELKDDIASQIEEALN